jgi:hypothetical protein
VQVGDKVIYSKFAGTEIKLQDQDHVLLKVRHAVHGPAGALAPAHSRAGRMLTLSLFCLRRRRM